MAIVWTNIRIKRATYLKLKKMAKIRKWTLDNLIYELLKA